MLLMKIIKTPVCWQQITDESAGFGSQVTKRPERHTEVHRALGEARQSVPGFPFSNA